MNAPMIRPLTLVLPAVLLAAPVASAQIFSGPAGGPPVASLPVFETNPGELLLGSPSAPIEVVYDGDAGPIEKVFTVTGDRDSNGIFDAADLVVIAAEFPVLTTVQEYFVVGDGSAAWADWHEEILTPGWGWGEAVLSIDGVPAGTVSGGAGDPVVWFDFPFAEPGSIVSIEKQLVFTDGTINDLASVFQQTVDFTVDIVAIEYPTVPEPTAAAMAVVAAAGVAARRRRRSL